VDITAQQDRRLYRFGLFEADLGQGTLNRQGTPVKLQEQPFRILALLLETPGEVLSREDLRKRIWPEGTFVEFDGSLNTALMKLRSALSDNARTRYLLRQYRDAGTGLLRRWRSWK
jgi:DNA-binding winged helix-turn-helix (wHTH) protein